MRTALTVALLLSTLSTPIGCKGAHGKGEPARMVQSVYMVDGLPDRVAARRLEDHLRDLDGVRSARVDLPNASALVTYDANRNDEQAIGSAIERAGYAIIVGDVEGPRSPSAH